MQEFIGTTLPSLRRSSSGIRCSRLRPGMESDPFSRRLHKFSPDVPIRKFNPILPAPSEFPFFLPLPVCCSSVFSVFWLPRRKGPPKGHPVLLQAALFRPSGLGMNFLLWSLPGLLNRSLSLRQRRPPAGPQGIRFKSFPSPLLVNYHV